jgi:hypothetical protein
MPASKLLLYPMIQQALDGVLRGIAKGGGGRSPDNFEREYFTPPSRGVAAPHINCRATEIAARGYVSNLLQKVLK